MTEKIVEKRLVSIKQAAEELGTTDVVRFQKTVMRLKCLIRVGSIMVVDLNQLETRLLEEATRQQKSRAKRATAKQSPAHKLGLCQARLTRAPELIAKKEKAIEEAEKELSAAQNPYDKRKAKKKLDGLQRGLEKLRENQKRDEATRDQILNAE